jgi:hypothetical protein
VSEINFIVHCANDDIVAFCTAQRAQPLVLPTIQHLTHRLRRLVPPDKSVFHSGPGRSGYKLQGIYYAKEYDLHTIWDFGDPVMIEMATDALGFG